MAYSVGLTLYNLAGRQGPASTVVLPSRPPGRLVWLHAPGEECLAVMQELARQLIEEDGVQVVLTMTHLHPVRGDAIVQPAPPDHPKSAQDFLDHWRPELAIFAGGELRPAMIYECVQRKIPLLMVQANAPFLIPGREGWYPGLVKGALIAFRHIWALDDAAARAYRKAGVEPGAVEVAGRLEEASAALPCIESDRSALAAQMATRPIWLAADIPPEEEAAVIAAHREALRLAHRLLLILVPKDPARAFALAEKLEADEDWRVALRRTEQEPHSEIEVYITDATEYGLWYRLAPVTYLGGSLSGAGCSRNPLEPAALGSAILYGPKSGIFGAACGRLGAARAARIVASGDDLAEALGDLLSPDRAARQARAAWSIVSEGTEATEKVMISVRALMDGEA